MKKFLMTFVLATSLATFPAVAQSTATTQQKTECCKEKACCNEGNACAKESKASCEEGNCPQRKMKDGKGLHKLQATREVRPGKGMRRDGEGLHKLHATREVGPGKEMRFGSGENPMFKGISLSDEQRAKMKALREQNKAAAKKSKAEAEAKNRDEMQKLQVEYEKEVEKVLDKDQLKQYKTNKAEMDARRAEKQAKLPKLEKKDK